MIRYAHLIISRDLFFLRILVVSCLLIAHTTLYAQKEKTDLFDLSLDELMKVVVESTSKQKQQIANAATAIHVISNEDIRRSSATTIPDLLASVPGIEVARLNSSTWAVTARGFNSLFANKLLVLIDGRSVYSPMFSGVFWDLQMPFLEDIEQIEIIRGPGSSIWGSNAVNGVVNIITKHSGDTQGGLLAIGSGNEESGFARLRYGHRIKDFSFRSYGQFRQRDDSIDAQTGENSRDDYQSYQLGSRIDLYNGENVYSLTGELFQTDKQYNTALSDNVKAQTPEFTKNNDSKGGFILGHWTHQEDTIEQHAIKVYFDWLDRSDSTFNYQQKTFDIDYQFSMPRVGIHQVILGASYRHIEDKMEGTYAFTLKDESAFINDFTAFLHNEISFSEQILATVGIKIEHTDFTGLEYQPSLRLVWRPNKNSSIWGAISRATRTPSRGGRGFHLRNGAEARLEIPAREKVRLLAINALEQSEEEAINTANSAVITGELSGNEDFDTETLFAYELGTRQQITPNFYIDLSAFYHEYKNLRTFNDKSLSIDLPNVVFEFEYSNDADGTSKGIELSTEYRISADWKTTLNYSYFSFSAAPKGQHSGFGVSVFEEQSPKHRVFLTSQHNLSEQILFDITAKHFGKLPDDNIPAYNDIDFSLRWRASENTTLSLLGANIVNDKRVEFQDTVQGPFRTEMERSIFVALEVLF